MAAACPLALSACLQVSSITGASVITAVTLRYGDSSCGDDVTISGTETFTDTRLQTTGGWGVRAWWWKYSSRIGREITAPQQHTPAAQPPSSPSSTQQPQQHL